MFQFVCLKHVCRAKARKKQMSNIRCVLPHCWFVFIDVIFGNDYSVRCGYHLVILQVDGELNVANELNFECATTRHNVHSHCSSPYQHWMDVCFHESFIMRCDSLAQRVIFHCNVIISASPSFVL